MEFERIYIGVDLATKIENSALFAVGETQGKLKIIYEPIQHLDAVGPAMPFIYEQIYEITSRHPAKEVIAAIDIPFGYPEEFVSWVSSFDLSKPTKFDLSKLKYRATERLLDWYAQDNWKVKGVTGLSVSMDKLGVTFTVGAELITTMITLRGFQASLGDRPTGSKTVIEVYPKASLMSWFKHDLEIVKKYRRSEVDRLILVRSLMEKFNKLFDPFLLAPIQFPSEHAVDAFVAAMTARAYAQDACVLPTETLPPKEGWIWIPEERS